MDALEKAWRWPCICCHSHGADERRAHPPCAPQLGHAHAAGFCLQAVQWHCLAALRLGLWLEVRNEALTLSSFTLRGQKLNCVGSETREGPCKQSGHALGEGRLLCPITQVMKSESQTWSLSSSVQKLGFGQTPGVNFYQF